MTARIVTNTTREPLAHIMYAFPWDGDAMRPDFARNGQLWEREAERDAVTRVNRMTAPIVGKLARIYFSDVTDEYADEIVREITAHRWGDVPGQLWEREAERSPELTDRYLDAWERANRQTHTIDAEPFDRAYAFGRYSILASGRVPRRRSIFYGLTSIDDE